MAKRAKVDSNRRSLLLGVVAVAILSLPVSAITGTMNQPKGDTTVRAGTVTEPRFYEGLDYSEEGFSYRIRHYTHMTDGGAVAGLVASAMFTIDAPSNEVWPYLKDFNSFEGPFGIFYTGVWGDLYTSEKHDLGQDTLQYGAGRRTTSIGMRTDWSSVPSRVLRVIPEHLLTLFETIPEDGSTDGMSPGFHTFILSGYDGKTVVTAIMEHSERMKGMTEEEALDRSRWGPKQYDNSESMKRWRDQFVPTLRGLVHGKRERMNQPKGDTTVRAGTVTEPRFHEGLDYSEEGFSYRIRHYTHMTDGGAVAGLVASLMFTIDAPSNEVWPYLKDFNSFEGPYCIHYTGVWGDLYTSENHDLGQETLQYQGIGWSSVPSRVLRVIPEHLLTLFETIPEDGSTDGMSPGFHTFILSGHDGKSVVTAIMEHAERMKGMTEEEALDRSMWGPKQYDNSASMKRWRDQFVPTIRELVYGKRETMNQP